MQLQGGNTGTPIPTGLQGTQLSGAPVQQISQAEVEEAATDFVFDEGFAPVAPLSDTPFDNGIEIGMNSEARRKRDNKGAEEIVQYYFDGETFTFPSSGMKLDITHVPEAAYQRYLWDVQPIEPPTPPRKTITVRKGKKISTPDYDNMNYLKACDVFETHNAAVQQHRIGEMMEYIYKKGVTLLNTDHYENWEDDFEEDMMPGAVVPDKKKLYIYLSELARTNAESKALLIAICGRDPLGGRDEAEDEEE